MFWARSDYYCRECLVISNLSDFLWLNPSDFFRDELLKSLGAVFTSLKYNPIYQDLIDLVLENP